MVRKCFPPRAGNRSFRTRFGKSGFPTLGRNAHRTSHVTRCLFRCASASQRAFRPKVGLVPPWGGIISLLALGGKRPGGMRFARKLCLLSAGTAFWNSLPSREARWQPARLLGFPKRLCLQSAGTAFWDFVPKGCACWVQAQLLGIPCQAGKLFASFPPAGEGHFQRKTRFFDT